MQRIVAFLALVVMTTFPGWLQAPVTLAQDATPAAAPGELDLAAMALIADDLPEGFGRGYGGSYIPGELFGDVYNPVVSREALDAAGLIRSYEDYYGSFDAPITIGLFIDEYETAEGAIAGYDAFDVEQPDETILSSTDLPAPEVGEEPSAMTATTTLYPDGIIADLVEANFRIGNLNAGIWEERYTFPDDSGTPVATPAADAAPDPEQIQHVEEMTAALAARIEAVLAGETPPGIDPALAAQTLPIHDAPGVALGQSWEGYRDGPVVLGLEGSLAPMAADVLGGYGRTVSFGEGADFPPPYVGVTVSELASPEAAMAVLDAVRAAPGDLPTPGVFPRGAARDLLADPSIPGADSALAFASALDEENPDAPADSARVVFVAGPKLVSVDVQGVDSVDAALAAATDLATQQAACLMADGPCTAVTAPALQPALPSPAESTPTA
jgi:hypothetical protein